MKVKFAVVDPCNNFKPTGEEYKDKTDIIPPKGSLFRVKQDGKEDKDYEIHSTTFIRDEDGIRAVVLMRRLL